MRQPFEENNPHRSPLRAGYFRYWEYYSKGYGVDPDVARDRLEALRWEQERRSMFNPNDANLPDEPLFYTRTRHTLSFGCQCRNCTKLYTITMGDAAFLRSIGITWKVPHVLTDGSGRSESPEQDSGEAGRTQEAQDIR